MLVFGILRLDGFFKPKILTSVCKFSTHKPSVLDRYVDCALVPCSVYNKNMSKDKCNV